VQHWRRLFSTQLMLQRALLLEYAISSVTGVCV
jgi:hypothetical protein